MTAPGLASALASVLAVSPAAAAEDIRDIRGPIPIPPVWPWLLLGAVALAALAAVAAAAYFLVRHLRRTRVKNAAELAVERLERARSLARPGNAAALGAEASDAVRAYIEARFAVRAAHRTTEEFFHHLLERGPTPIAAHRQALADFLGVCDLAKFARFDIAVEPMSAMIDAAQTFVRATSAPSEPEPARPPEGVAAPLEART